MANLKEKTIFMSGGSRGIGLAIAKRAAEDGANIIIAAKTAEPHPTLPGTIYTAADEIKESGGKALPLVCDIRSEEQVKSAVEAGVKKFGGIDICINNASAISLTPTMQTPMKRFDLMQQINTRGTFLVSQTCIPFLLKAMFEASKNQSFKTSFFILETILSSLVLLVQNPLENLMSPETFSSRDCLDAAPWP